MKFPKPKFKLGDLVIVTHHTEDKCYSIMQGNVFFADCNVWEGDPKKIEWFYGVEGYNTGNIQDMERVYVYEKEIEPLSTPKQDD